MICRPSGLYSDYYFAPTESPAVRITSYKYIVLQYLDIVYYSDPACFSTNFLLQQYYVVPTLDS